MAIRLANVLRGLAKVGELDVFIPVGQDTWEMPCTPPDVPVRRVEVMARPPGDFSAWRRVLWLARGALPSHFVGRNYTGVRERYQRWAAQYDLIWLSHLKSYVPLRSFVASPAILDFDDLEDRKAVERLALGAFGSGRRYPGPLRHAHSAVARLQAARNARLWRELQLDAVRTLEAVVVCNEQDRLYLGAHNAVVIPNGYDHRVQPVGRRAVGSPPTIVLPGMFRYPPNADAAQYLVQSIVPLVRARVPDLQVRLVGAPGGDIEALHDPPRTVVTGFVQDIKAELARADIIAVPIRYGGGTRIKVLEGFAHRIPVVSTSKGVEGIDAADGVHLLVGDTPPAFAGACVRLLTDHHLRKNVVEAAHALLTTRYSWERIHGDIATLVDTVIREGR